MNLNTYRDEAYKIAEQHGFHDEEYSIEHWKCLIISELMEAVEADRRNVHARIDLFEKSSFGLIKPKDNEQWNYLFNITIKDTVEDALADVCIRIFDLAGYKNVDLDFEAEKTPGIISNGTFTEKVYKTIHSLVGCELLSRCLILSLIRIFSIADNMNIDIEKHIQLKMEYNSSRPYKHGKKY